MPSGVHISRWRCSGPWPFYLQFINLQTLTAQRCDLSIALLNDCSPVLIHEFSNSLIQYPPELLPPEAVIFCHGQPGLMDDMNSDLAVAWLVLKKFSLLVNLGRQTQQFMRLDIIQGTMTAVMYRLLLMKFAPGSFDEAIRCGLLAFSHHIFLQWQDIKLPYRRFPTSFKSNILHPKFTKEASPQLMLWLLMIAAGSIFEVANEPWLHQNLREYANKCRVKSWRGVEVILESFMWINLLDDLPGKQIYKSLNIKNDK